MRKFLAQGGVGAQALGESVYATRAMREIVLPIKRKGITQGKITLRVYFTPLEETYQDEEADHIALQYMDHNHLLDEQDPGQDNMGMYSSSNYASGYGQGNYTILLSYIVYIVTDSSFLPQ